MDILNLNLYIAFKYSFLGIFKYNNLVKKSIRKVKNKTIRLRNTRKIKNYK